MQKVRKFFLWLFVLLICGVVLYFWISSYTYSEGSQTGYLMKFSHKGYVFKTYEGEMNLGGMNAESHSVVNNMWRFTVRTKEQPAIDSLNSYQGKIIKVYYQQVLKNYPWQGETPYFVYKVELVR
jgi:hypothetical protein